VAITRDQVVSSALAVADREGPDALAIRRVARELGVTPMALYRYVESKEELLAVVREYLWNRLDFKPRGLAWRNELREIARAFRRLVQEHPAAPTLLAGGSGEGEAERRICELMHQSFRSAGFDAEKAEVLYLQFSHFVMTLVRLDSKESPDGFELGLDLFLSGVAAVRGRR
jgi:TetR/AcrR family tetracycline transcriptional repressor